MTVASPQSDGSSDSSSPPIERIYVGGIDPQRLSIEVVADRLRRLVDVVSIETSPRRDCTDDDCFVGNGPTFFYLNARCAVDNETATSVLSKAYNNVKWRGCNLRVEAARPHFLDRLRSEREERDRERSQILEHSKDPRTDEIPATSRTNCPRNLRIRRRHGEEAFRVDTKPVEVSANDDNSARGGENWTKPKNINAKRGCAEVQWNSFSEALDKLRRKRAKHRHQYVEQIKRLKRQAKGRGPKDGSGAEALQDVGSPNGKVFLNRAIHLRFVQEQDKGEEVSASRVVLENKDLQAYGTTSEDAVSTASTISDESSSALSSNQDEKNSSSGSEKNVYDWSDEEEVGEIEGTMQQNDSHEHGATHEKEDINALGEEHISSEPDINKRLRDKPEAKEQDTQCAVSPGGYAWSDQSDDESDEGISVHDWPAARTRPTAGSGDAGCEECSAPTEYDEFSLALNFPAGDKDDDEDEDTVSNEGSTSTNLPDSEFHLEEDVTSNLNVLGQIFPDMAQVTPNIPDKANTRDQVKSGIERAMAHNSYPGWGLNGLMQRYDPTDTKSATLFEVAGDGGTELKSEEVAAGVDNGASTGEFSRWDHEDKGADSDMTASKGRDQSEEDYYSDAPDEEALTMEKQSMEIGNGATMKNDIVERKEIYEQGKLEGIFQEALSGGRSSGFRMSQLFQDKFDSLGNGQVKSAKSTGIGTERASSFSFSFNVGSSKDANHADGRGKSAGAFSFSFNMPSIDQGADAAKPIDTQTDTYIVGAADAAADTSEPDVPLHQASTLINGDHVLSLEKRRGLLFPESVLDELETSFFRMNEGERVIYNYEKMREDGESQCAWNDERKALTLDWKRKEKYAQKQKKMKY